MRTGLAALLLTGCLPLTSQLELRLRMPAMGPPVGLAAGDFNGDGKPDLVVTRGKIQMPITGSLGDQNRARDVPGSLGVFLGSGDGRFTPVFNTVGHADPSVGACTPSGTAVADFNGDGKQDIAVSNLVCGFTSILLGNGDGTFRAPSQIVAGNVPGSPRVGDFNGDGKLDLVVPDIFPNPRLDSGAVTVLVGNGDGTFAAGRSMNVGRSSMFVSVGDWNGDQRLDLAVSDVSKPAVWILFGRGDATFVEGPRLDTTLPPQAAVGCDFNKDGHLDLSVGVARGGLAYLGAGDGTFVHASEYYEDITRSAYCADINNDGMTDLVTARRLFMGHGTGSFTPSAMPAPPYDDSFVIAVDVNGDGWVDVVSADHAHETINVFFNVGGAGAPMHASR